MSSNIDNSTEIEIQSEIEEISFTESSAEISEVKIEVSEQSSKMEISKPKEVSVNAQIEISRIEESSVQPVAEPSKIPVSAVSVSLNKNSLSMMVGDTEKLTATILPENADDNTLEWYWSDAGVMNIDENGNVSVNTDALNQLWSTTNAQLDYSDLNDIKLTYTDPVTGERVELGSSWTIYYYNNDGTDTVITDSVSKLSSSSYRLLAEPTRTGYRFLGWYTNSSMSGTPRSAGSYYSVSNDTSFYAGWIRSDRIITDNTQSASQLTITSDINDHQSNYYSVDRDIHQVQMN